MRSWLPLLVALGGCNLILGIPEGQLDPPDPDAPLAPVPDAPIQDAAWRTLEGTVVETRIWEGTDAGPWIDGSVPPPDAGPVPDAAATDAGFVGPASAITEQVTPPIDLSGQVFTALIPSASAPDGFVVRTANGTAAGTFQIPDVPEGPYYLKWLPPGNDQPEIYVLQTSTPNLSRWIPGRPGTALATAAGTRLVLDVHGLAPWTTDDWFEILSPTLGVFWVTPPFNFISPPSVGATLLTSQVAWLTRGRGLFRPGDIAWVLQLSAGVSSTAVPIKTLSSVLWTDRLYLVDGKPTKLAGNLRHPPANQTVGINFRRSLFTPYEDTISPAGDVDEWVSAVVADPMPGRVGAIDYSHDLVVFQVPTGTADVDMGLVLYADPFPAAWARYYYGSMRVSRNYLAPGAATPVSASVFIAAYRTKSASIVELAPVITPPREPKLNGQDLFTDMTIEVSPSAPPLELTWTAPALGVPKRYQATLYKLQLNGTASTYVRIGVFSTTGTKLLIPKDMLPVPGAYFFFMSAYTWEPDLAWESAPRVTPAPESYGQLLTGVFTLTAPAKAARAR